MATPTNPQNSSFAQMDDGSKCTKQPINLFYSCTSNYSASSVKLHTNSDCSVVFLTTSAESCSKNRAGEQSAAGTESDFSTEEDEGDCAPFRGQSSKRVKTNYHCRENINLLSEKATLRESSQTDAIESHSTASLQRCSKDRDRKLRGSFDEESECSTACETHSDGITTHEASEFSPFMTFVTPKDHKMEELRLDDEFCLDTTSCSDLESKFYTAVALASSYEGTCTRKANQKSQKPSFRFTCKLKHTFDSTVEVAKEKWCSRCYHILKNLQEYAASFNGRVLNKYYDEKITFECERNHMWSISNKNAKKRWCSQCLKDNKKTIKQKLEEDRKKREMEEEEIQRKLFEDARRQSANKIPNGQSCPSQTSTSVGSQAALIQYLQKAEAEIEKVAKKKTAEFMASQDFRNDCTQDQILQVYKIIVMPEDILQTYMFNLSLECLRAEYKRLAKVIHPDKNKHPDAGNAFQRIHNMYESALGKLNDSC